MRQKMDFKEVKKLYMYEEYKGSDNGDPKRNSKATKKDHKHTVGKGFTRKKLSVSPAQYRRLSKQSSVLRKASVKNAHKHVSKAN